MKMVKIADHSAVIYGTHFPNRLFVGCLPPKAMAQDLVDFFSNFGVVNEAKIVLDENGNSRRFGFVSFGTQEGVDAVLRHGSIFFLGKKINVGPAVKKRFFDDVKGQPATLMVDEVTMKAQKEGVKSQVIYQPIKSSLPSTPTMASCSMMDNRPFPGMNQAYNYPPYITPAMCNPSNYPPVTMLVPIQQMPINTAYRMPQEAATYSSSSCSFGTCISGFPSPLYYPGPSFNFSSQSSPAFWSGTSSPSTISNQSPGITSPILLQQPPPISPVKENKQSSMHTKGMKQENWAPFLTNLPISEPAGQFAPVGVNSHSRGY